METTYFNNQGQYAPMAPEQILVLMETDSPLLLNELNKIILWGNSIQGQDPDCLPSWEKYARNIARIANIRARKANALKFYRAGHFEKEIDSVLVRESYDKEVSELLFLAQSPLYMQVMKLLDSEMFLMPKEVETRLAFDSSVFTVTFQDLQSRELVAVGDQYCHLTHKGRRFFQKIIESTK